MRCNVFHQTQNTTTKENETLMAVGTAYVQGEDVPGRGRVLLFSFASNSEPSQNLVCKRNNNDKESFLIFFGVIIFVAVCS